MQEFPYTPETISQLETAFSSQRLRRYYDLADGDAAQALRLYAWNTALSEAMFGIIHGLEITLRNAVQVQCSRKFSDTWYDALDSVWMPVQRSQIDRAKNQAKQRKKTPDAGDVMAELNFGFWTALFSGRYDVQIWRTALYPVFPRGKRRKDIYKKLSRVRELRNRIAHHEPILDHDLPVDYQAIIDTLTEISPDAAAWVMHHGRFDDVWKKRPVL